MNLDAINNPTPAETAEAHIPHHALSPDEKLAADATMRKMRLDRLRTTTEPQRLLAELSRLRFQMEDFLLLDGGPEEGSFEAFLQQYAQILNRKQSVLADEISLHPTKLNQILRGKSDPNQALFYRLEAHSSGQIPAVLWWQVFSKKLEHQIRRDSEQRMLEGAKVRAAFHPA